ncbi:FAD-dependent oxidoreductase [Mycobacterium sp. MYCO198283]|uniref:FAD-dependent oxidoreductase n=1 Tax=Mycobacterium sp. MYCO198283 TaxID=2883505 RepID=UPI001E39491F|nr:FAD-dependent oxidoreductase [Mycobacterium sp. MYCO198283]MCG5432476.1 FAD-dependent oxidoreductase [Mycobacterium sp. MYCO198283]
MAQRIVVIGAGIAGLATAVALQRRGHDVAVLEQQLDTSSGAGISIWPNALAALDELGVGAQVRAVGGGVSGGAIRWRDGRWLRRGSADRLVASLGEPLSVVRRSLLTRALADALAPGTVQRGSAVERLTIVAGGVRLHLGDGSVCEATGVVGADGVGSVAARHLNGPLGARYVGYTAWRGVAAHRLDPALAGETLGPSVEFGHVPLGPDHTYWFASRHAPEGEVSAGGELPHLRQRFADWAEPIPTLLASTDPADVLRHDVYDRDAARVWARGPVVLVGDAAHAMRPHLGQGGCQALEDAAILGAFVDGAGTLSAAFTRFVAYRRPRVAAVVRESKLVGRALNLRPAALSSLLARSTVLMPDALVDRHLASVASRDAFRMPSTRELAPA